MDYHSMKRKELQALCKEHNIPANLANSVLADKLSALLDEKPRPKTRQRTCMKSPVESTDEGEPAELKRQAKKVRFSPNNDLVEYQLRPGEKQKDTLTQTKTRRKSVAKKVDKSVDDNNITVELNDDIEQIPVKVTRSRVQSSVKEVVITDKEKKKGIRVAKDVEKETVVDKETEVNVGKVTRSKAKGGGVQHEENKQPKSVVEEETETVEETAVARARVTRSKAQTLTVDGTVSEANPKKKSGRQVTVGGTVSDANPKKKSGEQVETEEQNVKPSNVPVRATRSRRQTIKEDIENTVTNNAQTDKKRTRREMKATDSSHVAPVDKQELPKRKSLRTRGVETVVEDESDKKEVVNKSRVTRSKAPLAKETSGGNKNKASKVEIQQPVEPIKHEGKKSVNRRKSVLQTEKFEEPVKHPSRKNTRRKSVVQKATKTVESPTVGKKQSKGLSGNVEDRENVSRSVKDVAENVFEEVNTGTPKSLKRRGTPIKEDRFIESPKGSTRSASRSEGNSIAGTPNSRKRRETPIIEDPIIEKFTKGSARSSSKSERKSVAKKQVESSLKKPMSKGRSSAIRSGAIISDSSSKKRAKLSETKQTDFEDHAVNSTKEWTPVAKMNNLKLDEVSEPEVTPAVKSGRRFTRSTIKEQPIAEAQLFSPKVSKFKHDPAINTAPGRITRWGVKHDGNAAGNFSEKVGKKKQTRLSAHKKSLDDAEVASLKVTESGPTTDAGTIEVQSEVKQLDAQVQMSSHEVAEVGSTSDVSNIGDQSEVKQPLDEVQMSAPEVSEVVVNPDVDTVGFQSEIEQSYDNVQMSSPKVAEVQPNSDADTTGAESEISKEVAGQTLGDLSASESSRLPTIVVEENIVSVEEKASVEIMEDAGACNEKSVTENLFSEKQQSPLESQSLDAGTTGTPLGENLSHILMMPVPMADAADTVPVQNQNEEVYVVSGVFTKAAGTPLGKNLSHIEIPPVPMADVAETLPVQDQNKDYVESRLFTEDLNLETSVLKSGRHDATEKEMESTESGSTLNGMQTDVMIEEPLVSVCQTVVVDEAVDNRRDPSLQISSVDKNDVTDVGQQYDEDRVDVQENPFSGNDVYDVCDNAVADRVSHLDMSGTPMIGKGNVQDDDINVSKELETGSERPYANINIERVLDDNSDVQDGESEHDKSVNNDSLSDHNQLTSNDDSLAIDVDVGGDNSEPAQNESVPVADEVLVKSCNKGEQSLNVAVEDVPCDTAGQSDLITSKDAPEGDTFVRVDALDELVAEADKDVQINNDSLSDHNQLTSNDSLAIDVDVGGDNSEPAQNESVPVADEVLVKSCNKGEQSLNVAVEDVPCDTVGQSDLVTSKDAPEGDTFVRVDALDELVVEADKDVQINNDSLSDHNQLTSNDSLAIDVDVGGDNSESAQNENVPVADEVLVKSCNKGEQLLNVAVEDVPCDTVGQSDLVTSKDAPEGDTFVRVDALDELVADADKDVVSSILGDIYDLDEGDDGNEQNLPEFDEGFQPKESGSISSNMRSEWTKEAETSRWNDLTLGDEQAAAVCDDVESGKFMKHGSHMKSHEDPTREEASPISYTKGESTTDDVNSSQLAGDIGANESLITQESSPITYKKEESFVNDTESDILKEDVRNKTDTPRSASTSIDWGDFDITMDAFEKPASANGSADMEGKGKTDVQDSDFQAFARSSACLTNSARKLEKDSGNADDENSNQEVDILKESVNSADMTEVFNWPDLSLKSLLTTPGASKTSHINDSKGDAVNFAFPDSRDNEDNGSSRTAAHQFNHQRDNSPSKDYDGETQGNAARDPENEIQGVPSIEEYSKLFEDEEVSNAHFESKQFKSSNEAAETSHPSGLKDNSTCKEVNSNEGAQS